MRTLYAALLALTLLAPARATAQSPVVVPMRGDSYSVTALSATYAPNRIDVVEYVDQRCPGLIRQDHAFTDAVATLLHQEDASWGRNGKRGNPNDPSHDAISRRTAASPLGVAIIDIIGDAGGPNPSPAWIDQTDETIRQNTTGVWVAPSGVLPACLTGGGGGGGTTPPPVVPPPPTPPTPAVDLAPVLQALERIEARLSALESRPAPSLDLFARYVDDMVGAGPADDPSLMPNHVTDVKQRLDVIRTQLEQLAAWLRSRSIFRF